MGNIFRTGNPPITHDVESRLRNLATDQLLTFSGGREEQKEWGTNYVALATSFLGSVFTGRALLRPHQRPAFARGMLIGIFVVAGLILILSWVHHAINKLSPAKSIWRKNVSKGIEWAMPVLALLLTIAGGVWIGMN